MANRFWVGGTGTWDNLALLKWASTSGGVGGASLPTSADDVLFDANSGASTVTIGSGTAICSTLTMTGFTGTLAFGSNSINLAGSGTIYTGATTFSVSGTPLMLCTSSNTANRVVVGGAVTEANSISFNVTAGPNAFAANGSFRDLIFSGTFTGSLSNSVKTMYGNLTFKTGMTISAGASGITFAATSGTQTITSAGLNLDFPITVNAIGATVQLQDALAVGTTTGRRITLTSGTLDLNNRTLTNFGDFVSTNSNTRSIAFGGTGNYTNTYNLGGTLTIFNMAIATNFSITGTPTINVSGNPTTGIRRLDYGTTNAPASPEANSLSFYVTAGSDTIQLTGTSITRNLDFTGSFTGTLSNSTRSIYGNYTLNSNMTVAAGTLTTSFLATSGTQLIRTFARNVDIPITFNTAGATVRLEDALSVGTATSRAIVHTAGTLDLNDKTFTIFGSFTSNNGNTRTIAFGAGQFYLTNTAASWRTDNAVGLTMTGSKTVNFTYSGSVGTRAVVNTNASGSASTAINLNVTAGTDIVSGQGFFNDVDFTGYTGAASFAGNIVRNLKYNSGMTNSSTNTTVFQNWTGTQTFTSNAVTLDAPLTISQASGITAASCIGTTATVTHGTLSSFFFPVGSTITIAGVTPGGYNGTFTVTAATLSSVSYTVGSTLAVGTAFGTVSLPTTLQLVGPLTVGSTRTTTFNAGIFDLNNQSFTTGSLDADAANTKTILFGTAEITVTGNGRNVCSSGGSTTTHPFTYTGTGRINCVYSGSVGTRSISNQGTTEANTLNYFINAGSDTFQITGNRTYKRIDFTGFTGTVTITGTGGATIYGDFTAPVAGAAVGFTGFTFGLGFQSSGTQTFTTNGYTFDYPISRSGATGTLVLADDLNMIASISTGQFTLNAGTFNSNSKNITCALFNFNNAATKTLTLTNSTVTITGGSSTAGFIGISGGTTYNVTGTNIVFTTSGIASFFAAGSTLLNVIMSGSGQLIIGTFGTTQTINTLQNTVQPCTISLRSDALQLTVNTFDVNGTPGNLVTFNSDVAGIQRNIRKTSGTVNSQYLYIQDSNAAGGAVWRASNSVNAGNNTGWLFDYLLDVFEDFSAADTIDALKTFNTDASELITLADTPTGFATFAMAITEDASFLDNSSVLAAFAAAIVEAADLAESSVVTLVFNSAISEALTLADTPAATAVFAKVILENIGVADSQSVATTFAVVVSEGSNLADLQSVLASFVSSLSEALTAADFSIGIRIHNSDISEAFTVADAQTALRIHNALVAENLAPADAAVVIASFTSQITENLVLLDEPFPRGWYAINDGQVGNWAQVNNAGSGTWVSINDGQTVTWVPINNNYP